MLNRGDQHHQWTRRALARAQVPAFTVDAVVSECLFLLRRNRLDPRGLFSLLEGGALSVESGLASETARVAALCRTYADVPMSWADASLVVLSEKRPKAQLVSFDSDFTVYRRFGRERLPLVAPRPHRR